MQILLGHESYRPWTLEWGGGRAPSTEGWDQICYAARVNPRGSDLVNSKRMASNLAAGLKDTGHSCLGRLQLALIYAASTNTPAICHSVGHVCFIYLLELLDLGNNNSIGYDPLYMVIP